MQRLVRFRLEFSVRDLGLREDESLEFSLDRPSKGLVLLRGGQGEPGLRPGEAIGFATVERDPGDAVGSVLRSLSQNILPPGVVRPQVTPEAAWTAQVQGERFTGVLHLDGFPADFQAYCLELYGELWDIARATTLAFRWRANIDGPHNPFRSRRWQFCLESDDWKPGPSTIHGRMTLGLARPIDLSPIAREVGELVGAGGEPLGHQMLREAWLQRQEDPRSAVVIGIAALEVGVKEYISLAVPPARWLVEEMPSPPVVRMLSEFLPSLPRVGAGDGIVRPPPDSTLKALRKGVRLRNSTAHIGAKISSEDAEEILRAVRDVLWLLDYYRGNRWVLEYVHGDVRAVMLEGRGPSAP